jgi:hypothetical protein
MPIDCNTRPLATGASGLTRNLLLLPTHHHHLLLQGKSRSKAMLNYHSIAPEGSSAKATPQTRTTPSTQAFAVPPGGEV